ncbi:MAG: serine/threonine protein kinase [candidate division Zixibacteria bacterium]|nr:serine/threonine protein kinase [candidate division Zixibacteria bacterium]MDH3937630.1 serine/threonine protein kinase [candidate division Zixibacteria bacterium]
MNQEFIGSYKILEKKGEGGMAQVYLAVHQDVPNLKVILKVLSDPRLGERFKQEADKLALLDGHPSICRIKHFFSHGDNIVIAMEYIDGATLEDKIKSMNRFEVGEAVQVANDVLDILAFAHQKDIYHRDIKPGNIMIDNVGQTKVIDFGIAKGKTDPNLTIAGTACGTPAYMAPEQFNPTEQANYALWDIYAVGTTLYMMLCGQVPFTDENPFAIRDAKLFNDPPAPSALNSSIPKPLEEVILKSLARDADRRYQTAEQMQDGLSPFLSGGPTKRRTPSGGMTIQIPPPKPGESKRRWLVVVTVAAALALTAPIYHYVIKDKSASDQSDPDGSGDTTLVIDQTDPPFEPPQGILEISVKPEGDIYLDGSLLKAGADAWMVDVDSGQHIVRVENNKATTKVFADTFAILPDSTQRLNYAFSIPEPPPPPPEVKVYKVKIGSQWRKKAEVLIDNVAQADSAPWTYTIVEGEHNIRIKFDDETGRPQDLDTTVQIDSDTRITFPK